MNKYEGSSLKVEVVTEWYANQRDRDYVLVFNSEIEILNGNYIRVDTTISNDKNYLNQQPKQLNSTTFRGPTPSAARKNTTHGVNRYINPQKIERVFRVFRGYNVIKIPKIP